MFLFFFFFFSFCSKTFWLKVRTSSLAPDFVSELGIPASVILQEKKKKQVKNVLTLGKI